MSRPSIDEYYIEMTLLAAQRAGCPKRKVGVVITDANNRVLSTGYNSPPRDLPACTEVYCGAGVGDAICISPHAEQAAIAACRDIQSARTIYISCSPCTECAKLIMATQIERIVFAEFHKTWHQAKRIWTGKTTYMEAYDATCNSN